MSIPSIEELEEATLGIMNRAREEGELSKLTVRIVRQRLEKDFSLSEGALEPKEYKEFIKETVVTSLHNPEKANPSKKRKSTHKPPKKTETRKQTSKAVVTSSDDEPEDEEDEEFESEAPPKKTTSRSKATKEKPEKAAKSRKISKKPESNKYKSVAIIEASDEDEPEESAPPPHSPKKEPKSPRALPSKRKQPSPAKLGGPAKKVVKAGSDADMSDYGEPGPSTSKPKNTAKSQKPRSPKKKDPVEKDSMKSELSSVIDEPPRKRQKKQRKDTEKPQKSEKAKREKKTKEPLSKDEETVNRLKSIVVACGVRKTWKKEFDGLEKPSQQVKRLNEILGDLGMLPRYTLEKAKAIKQQRELAQELRDVQEFDKATRRRGSRNAKDPSEAEESGTESDNDAEELPAQKKTSARARVAALIRNLCDED